MKPYSESIHEWPSSTGGSRRGGGGFFITDCWKNPVLLLIHGYQEPHYYHAHKHGPLLMTTMIYFDTVQFSISIFLGGGAGIPIHIINRNTRIPFFWDVMLYQSVIGSDCLSMQCHIPEEQNPLLYCCENLTTHKQQYSRHQQWVSAFLSTTKRSWTTWNVTLSQSLQNGWITRTVKGSLYPNNLLILCHLQTQLSSGLIAAIILKAWRAPTIVKKHILTSTHCHFTELDFIVLWADQYIYQCHLLLDTTTCWKTICDKVRNQV
jgi:hypothetical protein